MPRKKPRDKPDKPRAKPKPKKKPDSPCSGTSQTKPAKPARPRRREAPPQLVIRNNSKPTRAAALAPAPAEQSDDNDERAPILERIGDMGGTHLLAGIGGGVCGQAIALATVSNATLGPKTAAGVVMGAGGLTTGTGWYLDMDHVMAAGIGMTAAGTLALTNQLAADAYESIEKRAEDKRKKKDAEESDKRHAKALAEARALIEAEDKKHRNARYIEIRDPSAPPPDEPDEYPATTA